MDERSRLASPCSGRLATPSHNALRLLGLATSRPTNMFESCFWLDCASYDLEFFLSFFSPCAVLAGPLVLRGDHARSTYVQCWRCCDGIVLSFEPIVRSGLIELGLIPRRIGSNFVVVVNRPLWFEYRHVSQSIDCLFSELSREVKSRWNA